MRVDIYITHLKASCLLKILQDGIPPDFVLLLWDLLVSIVNNGCVAVHLNSGLLKGLCNP